MKLHCSKWGRQENIWSWLRGKNLRNNFSVSVEWAPVLGVPTLEVRRTRASPPPPPPPAGPTAPGAPTRWRGGRRRPGTQPGRDTSNQRKKFIKTPTVSLGVGWSTLYGVDHDVADASSLMPLDKATSRGFWVPWAGSLWHKRAGVASLWTYFITMKLSTNESAVM